MSKLAHPPYALTGDRSEVQTTCVPLRCQVWKHKKKYFSIIHLKTLQGRCKNACSSRLARFNHSDITDQLLVSIYKTLPVHRNSTQTGCATFF